MGSTGADVEGPAIRYTPDGLLADLTIAATLPGSGLPKSSDLEIRERWSRPFRDQPWRLLEYAYELIDRQRDARRALHLHDAAWFVDRYQVVVHEHCEQPIGTVSCDHYFGLPTRDGFDAVDRLMRIWTDDAVPDCSTLVCLD